MGQSASTQCNNANDNRSHYEGAVKSSGTFLTVLSLFPIVLALIPSTCSERLTRVYIILLIASVSFISIIALVFFLSAARDFKEHEKSDGWLFGIACGWLLFAAIAAIMAGFTFAERDGLMLSACKMCPEGFSGRFDASDVASVCGQYLKQR